MLSCKRMGKQSTIADAVLQRDFLSVLIVVVNTFSWYFPLYLLFQRTLEELQVNVGSTLFLTAYGVQYAAAIGFALIGAILVKRFSSRSTFLSFWMVVGIIASLLMVMLESFNSTLILIISFIIGTALGLGFPSCLSYFGDHSNVENRGLLGGITFFASGLSILIVGLITNFSSLIIGSLVLAAWRGVGLLSFYFVRTKQDIPKENAVEVSYKIVLSDRSFLLYFLPWLLFCLVNFLEIPIELNLFGEKILLGQEIAIIMPIAEYGIGSFVALIGGWFADSVGRKRIVIIGFIVLGFAYAILGVFPGEEFSWYSYIIVDGVAWGIFSLMFYLVLWSELAGNRVKEKYYLIGLLPFLVANYVQILFTPFVGLVDEAAAFSFASFFLFLAVLPLVYAPETMPQKQIEMKRLRKFADDAQKAKEKYERLGL
jgi:MFS family permease